MEFIYSVLIPVIGHRSTVSKKHQWDDVSYSSHFTENRFVRLLCAANIQQLKCIGEHVWIGGNILPPQTHGSQDCSHHHAFNTAGKRKAGQNLSLRK